MIERIQLSRHANPAMWATISVVAEKASNIVESQHHVGYRPRMAEAAALLILAGWVIRDN